MLEDITKIDQKIIGLFTHDYTISYSIRAITQKINANYSNTFKRMKRLIKKNIFLERKEGSSNLIYFNIKSPYAMKLLSFIESQQKINNSSLELIINKATLIDPFVSIGLFGSRVSGKATKDSDWDIFILTCNPKEINKLMSFFPHIRNIQVQVFSLEEFRESLISKEETVVKHIIRNKQMLYNPYPFYNLIQEWEMIKYAPRS
jgi:predicted nucleotidyltransferase